jgi:hypothetical protein
VSIIRRRAGAAREDAWREIATEPRRFEQDGAFSGPCELLVAAGPNPGN